MFMNHMFVWIKVVIISTSIGVLAGSSELLVCKVGQKLVQLNGTVPIKLLVLMLQKACAPAGEGKN